MLTLICPESAQSRVVVSLSSDEGSRTQMPPADWTFMMIIKHVLYVPEVKSWLQHQKTCLVFLFLQKRVVDSFSPERRWSPNPRQQHRDHRETRGRGNRGLEVLHRYTEDPDQVHPRDNIWCVLLKMALPATLRMDNSHSANMKTYLSVEVKNKRLSVWSLHLHFHKWQNRSGLWENMMVFWHMNMHWQP